MKTPYEIAKDEMAIGVHEVAGPGNNPRIIEYHKCTTLKANSDEVPWCSAFMNYCVNRARLTGWTGQRETENSMARSWLNWGFKIDKPQEGDLVVFRRGNNNYSGHVAFVVSISTLWITCLGGNQSDSVCIEKFARWRVLGYRRGIIEGPKTEVIA